MVQSNASLEPLQAWIAGRALEPRDGVEADAWADAAAAQGLSGLLRAHAAGKESWPNAARTRLEEAHRLDLARVVLRLDLAARVQDRLLSAGIRSLPLKGAAVAERLYDCVGDRPMDDVDLLVLDDFARARRLLLEDQLREGERADHAVAFSEPGTGLTLELHRSVTSCPGLFPVAADELWARSRAGTGSVARVPGAEDLFLQLALHASFQHAGVLRLIQHLDLRRSLEREAIDPERLLTLATDAHALSPLAAAVILATRLAGARVPAELAAALARALPSRLQRFFATAPIAAFIAPAPAATVQVRLGLTRGRRAAFLARTLAPAPIAEGERGRTLLGRSVTLARRWISSRLAARGSAAGTATP